MDTGAAPEALRGVVDGSRHERGGPALRALASLVDSRATGRVLVHGSPPHLGRDLDVVVPHAGALDADALTGRLADAALDDYGDDQVLVHGSSAAALSVTPLHAWGLAPDAAATFVSVARPLDGYERLARPAPRHELLVLARRLAVYPGQLHSRHRERIQAAVDDDPTAWDDAATDSGSWGCPRALTVLARACAHDGRIRRRDALVARVERRRHAGQPTPLAVLATLWSLAPRPAARLRNRRRRGAVVSLSGIDGSGKSTQAQLLADALWAVGHDTVVEWSRITFESGLERIARPVKAVLSLRSRARAAPPASPAASPRGEPVDDEAAEPVTEARALRQRSRVVGSLWAGVVAVVHAWTLRRATLRHLRAGRVIVRDRYLLDSVVQLEWAYADGRDLGWQTRLIRMLVPRATSSFFLDVDAARAHDRKPEEFDVDQLGRHRATYLRHTEALDVTVVDGGRSRDEVFATLLRATLDHLGPPGS